MLGLISLIEAHNLRLDELVRDLRKKAPLVTWEPVYWTLADADPVSVGTYSEQFAYRFRVTVNKETLNGTHAITRYCLDLADFDVSRVLMAQVAHAIGKAIIEWRPKEKQ